MNNTLFVALTCDTDADIFDPSLGGMEHAPQWLGVQKGIPAMYTVAESIANDFELKVKFTWFVRVDDHVAFYHDDPCYLLNKYSEMWEHRRKAGDEIAWHPHIYSYENKTWGSETNPHKVEEILKRNSLAFALCESSPRICRIGEAWFDNNVAKLLDDIGIICDSTAMPGRLRQDEFRTLDWRATPQLPFHPSINDYRIPGTDPRNYLEVPMSMIKVKAPYDTEPYFRYVDLSFHHALMKKGLNEFIEKSSLLVSMTHPSGVLSSLSPEHGHGLISFDLDNYYNNLYYIVKQAQTLGKEVKFITMSEIPDLNLK